VTDAAPTNDGQQFDRLPETPDDREVDGRASRREVLDWWDERFGIEPTVFEEYSFWEKGAGKSLDLQRRGDRPQRGGGDRDDLPPDATGPLEADGAGRRLGSAPTRRRT